MFVERIRPIDIVAKAICGRNDEIPVRQVHRGRFFAQSNMQCVPLVSGVMRNTCRVCNVGPKVEIAMDGGRLAIQL